MAHGQDNQLRQEILKRWVDAAFSVYPENTVRLLNNVKDQFRNPVGETIRSGLADLLPRILAGDPIREVPEALDRILRIRSVQDMAAPDAVRFLVELKPIITAVHDSNGQPLTPDRQQQMGQAIDTLVLMAFGVYQDCREQLYRIRANEEKARNTKLLERAQQIIHHHSTGQDIDMKDTVQTHPHGGGRQ